MSSALTTPELSGGYEPLGLRAWDAELGEVLLCEEAPWQGWLCVRSACGAWRALLPPEKAGWLDLDAARAALASRPPELLLEAREW